MTETTSGAMSLEDYLARGGVLTAPGNASGRYRGEIMRLMASFVDSELAGSAGFTGVVNDGPGIRERIVALRISLEKLDHAERVLRLMGEFGADTGRYFSHHPWTERLPRTADIGASRQGADMRLSVLHYPLDGWNDAVVMNVLMGIAVTLQLSEYLQVSYQPLADAFRQILPRERRHTELGIEGLRRLVSTAEGRRSVGSSLQYWYPRVAMSFGVAASPRFAALQRLGLRHTPNEQLHRQWESDVAALLGELGIASFGQPGITP